MNGIERETLLPMYNDMYSSHLFVDLGILRENARSIMADLGDGVEMIPVLKDDAYGLGLLPVARTLAALPGVRTFTLAQVSECVRLREAGIGQDLLIIGGIPGAHVRHAVACDAVMTVGRLGLVPQIAREAQRQGKQARVHIKIETGLNRIGLKPGEELAALIAELKAAEAVVAVDGAFSHFSDIKCVGLDDSSREQLARFKEGLAQLAAAGIRPRLQHMCQSAASEWMPEARFNAARIGRRLYMDHQDHPHVPGTVGAVRELASWRATITNLRQLEAGATLGYGGQFHLDAPRTIATVSVGYGDGLNIQLAESYAPVLVNGQQGRLMHTCMDQCFVDVTGIDCAVDDTVTFFGYSPEGLLLPSQEVAKPIGCEGVSLTAGLFPRVQRVYLGEES